MQRLTFLYLGSYLVAGGLGFLLLPEFTMRLDSRHTHRQSLLAVDFFTGDQPSMPAQQRRRHDDEGSPTRAREELARKREQHPVDGGDRRTACGAPKDREVVQEDDDFEVLIRGRIGRTRSPGRRNMRRDSVILTGTGPVPLVGAAAR